MTTSTSKSEDDRTIRRITSIPRRLFAVGDIHGCSRELLSLLKHLEGPLALSNEDLVVFIGDYIDRGVFSKIVVDQLIEFKTKFPSTVFLRGNHEDMFLSYLGLGGYAGEVYLDNGGVQTLESYGIPEHTPPLSVLSLIPEKHRRFYNELEYGVEVAEFLLVHAGIRPGVELDQQNPHDLMWIRAEFTTSEHSLGKTVVFGHTPYEDVLIHLPYKVGIDTGAVYGNMLSCIELVEGDVFQVDFGDTTVKAASLRDRLGSRTTTP